MLMKRPKAKIKAIKQNTEGKGFEVILERPSQTVRMLRSKKNKNVL